MNPRVLIISAVVLGTALQAQQPATPGTGHDGGRAGFSAGLPRPAGVPSRRFPPAPQACRRSRPRPPSTGRSRASRSVDRVKASEAVWVEPRVRRPASESSAGSGRELFGPRLGARDLADVRTEGRCRLWVGAAGGGVWRTDDAMNADDPGWRWVGQGLGTNSIGSLALDPNDRSGDTIYVGTGETNQPQNSGAGTGLYRSTDGGDHWTRIPTMIVDPAVSPAPIDFTSTRGISTVVVEPRQSADALRRDDDRDARHDGGPRRADADDGLSRSRASGSTRRTTAERRGRSCGCRRSIRSFPPNPNLGVGVGDTMFGVRHVKLDPQESAHRLRHGLEQRHPPFGAVAREAATPRSSRSTRSSGRGGSRISRCST